MDLLSGAKVTVLWASTAAGVGSTGDAGGSTAGSTSAAQSTGGGYPTATTGLNMTGYRNVAFFATVAGTTSVYLKSGFSTVGSSAAVTGWTAFPLAAAGFATTTLSTAYTVASLDVVNVAARYVNAIVQVPTSSAILTSVIALQYNPEVAPVTQSAVNDAGDNIARGSTSA